MSQNNWTLKVGGTTGLSDDEIESIIEQTKGDAEGR
jgi:hypothetical protein